MRAALRGVFIIDNAMGRRISVPYSAMVRAGAFYVLYENPLHDLKNFVGIGKLCEAQCSSFSLAVDEGPLIDQRAVMRKDLARMVPLVETGQGTVEIVVGILNFLEKDGVILYGLSVVA
jgi:hypothetical protein